VRACLLQHHPHVSAGRRELESVGEQVPHDLLQPGGVASHRADGPIQFVVDRDAFRLGGRLNGFDGRINRRCKIDALHLQLQLARNDPADVEQVRDQLGLKPRVSGHDPQAARDQCAVCGLSLYQLSPSEDGVQGRPQFVRDHGDEIVFQAALRFRSVISRSSTRR
jgi:hypothetical protein